MITVSDRKPYEVFAELAQRVDDLEDRVNALIVASVAWLVLSLVFALGMARWFRWLRDAA